MRGVSLRTTPALVAAAAALFLWASAAEAATTRVTPASGPLASKPTLVGTGFRPRKVVKIVLGRAQVAKVRANAKGKFKRRFTIPLGTSFGNKRLRASDGKRSVANKFSVTRKKPSRGSSMTASSRGHRFRLAPTAGTAGTELVLRGWRFPAGGAIDLLFAGALEEETAANGRGRFSASFDVPAGDAGRRAVVVRSAKPRLGAPFLVKDGDPPPPPPDDLGSWTPKKVMPEKVLDAGSAVLDGKLYAIAGKVPDGHQSDVHVYTPDLNSWTKGPELPGPAVENPAVVAHGGSLYAFGGSTAPFSGAKTNAARFTPGKGWEALEPMPSARAGATAQSLDGKIYVIGGMNEKGESLASVRIYDPGADEWDAGPTLNTARDNPGSAVLRDANGQRRIYVFGGRTTGGDGTLASVEYLVGGSWESRRSMPTGRRTMAVGTLNGRAQLVGGEQPTVSVNEEYDPKTNTWRTLTAVPTGRHGSAFGTINGVLYVAGGAVTKNADSDANEAFKFGG